jgi:molybdenum cofactor synthesis domain-containing protein
MKVGILTVSDKGSKGEREDKSGKVIEEMMRKDLSVTEIEYDLVADEKDQISKKLIGMIDEMKCSLVITTGGTGLGARDVTPEATMEVIEKTVPGIAEAMRQASLAKTPRAMLSRAICGIRKKSLIVNLPGSPKAVRECLEVILPVLPHAVEVMLKGSAECGQPARRLV